MAAKPLTLELFGVYMAGFACLAVIAHAVYVYLPISQSVGAAYRSKVDVSVIASELKVADTKDRRNVFVQTSGLTAPIVVPKADGTLTQTYSAEDLGKNGLGAGQ